MTVDFPSFNVEPGERKEITMRTSRVLVAPKLLFLEGDVKDLWVLSFYFDDGVGKDLMLLSTDGVPAVVFDSPDQPELHRVIPSMALIGLEVKNAGSKRRHITASISASDTWSDRWVEVLSSKGRET